MQNKVIALGEESSQNRTLNISHSPPKYRTFITSTSLYVFSHTLLGQLQESRNTVTYQALHE